MFSPKKSTMVIEANEPGVLNTSDDTYAEYANCFDLSLLPMDESEIDLIPELHQHQQQQHQQSNISPSTVAQSTHNLMHSGGNSVFTVSSTPPLSPEYIPAPVYEPSTHTSFTIKTETWPTHNINVPKVIVDESASSIGAFASRTPSEEQFLTIFPPSPTPSIDFNSIKKEQSCVGTTFGLYPPSPPDSNGAPSPIGYQYADIKTEPFDLGCNETSINLTSFLPNSFDLAANTLAASSSSSSPYDSPSALHSRQQHQSPLTTSSPSSTAIPTLTLTPPPALDSRKDHQLLREYLQDTSFQKKHNLKPLALESLFVGDWSARGDIEPVISLALEHARKDMQQTCVTLNISADPEKWNCEQVRAWLQFTVKQFKLPSMPDIERVFTEDGVQLSQLNEIDFINRLPQAGATLFAQLEIWKAACCDSQLCYFDGMSATDALMTSMSNEMQSWPTSMDCDAIDETTFKTEGDDELSSNSATYDCTPTDAIDSIQLNQTSASELLSVLSSNDASMVVLNDGEQTKAPEPIKSQSPSGQTSNDSPTPTKTGRHGSAHIHLWQFLKELLQTPQTNGTAIRWLDRTKGVFKIEDSVRVARLWGRRKNRPAMNYDKLSRSIRQYYKKGIMKKTERSQRLVYQFCHPYNM